MIGSSSSISFSVGILLRVSSSHVHFFGGLHDILFYFNKNIDIIIEMQQKQLNNIFNKLESKEVNVPEKIKNIKIVHSNASGVGKSFAIRKEASNKTYIYFPIGGDFTREDVIKRLHQIEIKTKRILPYNFP